jgi:tetratricopeptide (TPR) repeat protein
MTTTPRRPGSRFVLMLAIGVILVVAGGWIVIVLQRPSTAEFRREYQQAIESRNWNQAEIVATRWTESVPDSGEAWLQRSASLFHQRKYQPALDCLNRISPTSPEAKTSLYAKMELQFGPLNRPADGAATCQEIIKIDPRSALAREQLIKFLAVTLQRTRLIREIRLAIDAGVEPADSYFYLFFIDVLPFADGAELNHHCLQGDPDSELFEVAEAIFRAESLETTFSMDDQDNARAIRRAISEKNPEIERLQRKYPHNTELLVFRIRHLIQNGDLAEVVKRMAQATVEAEEDHRFWRFKGWVHAQQEEDDNAEKAFRHAIQLNPLDWTTRHMLAEVLQREQRLDEVKQLRDLVARANHLRRLLQATADDRQVSAETALQIADYAADCGDEQLSQALRRQLQQSNALRR